MEEEATLSEGKRKFSFSSLEQIKGGLNEQKNTTISLY